MFFTICCKEICSKWSSHRAIPKAKAMSSYSLTPSRSVWRETHRGLGEDNEREESGWSVPEQQRLCFALISLLPWPEGWAGLCPQAGNDVPLWAVLENLALLLQLPPPQGPRCSHSCAPEVSQPLKHLPCA